MKVLVAQSYWLFATHGLEPARLLCPWNSPGKNTRVSSPCILQGIFLTQGLKLGLPNCKQILYHLSHHIIHHIICQIIFKVTETILLPILQKRKLRRRKIVTVLVGGWIHLNTGFLLPSCLMLFLITKSHPFHSSATPLLKHTMEKWR